MTNREFILEALKRITPDTGWHGETCADNISIDNIGTLEEMIYFLLDELFIYSAIPEGNKGNGSFEAIARKKQKIISFIKEEYFDNGEKDKITLEEFWNSKKNLAIHCDTEEKANKLLKAFDEYGKRWCSGERYIDDNCWSEYKEKTCYDNEHDDSGYCNVNFYKENDYKIYEFEDIDLDVKVNIK